MRINSRKSSDLLHRSQYRCCYSTLLAVILLTALLYGAVDEAALSGGTAQLASLPKLEQTQMSPLRIDTLLYDFTSSLEGWGFLNSPDSVQEYYPDASCIERWRMITVSPVFSIQWSSFSSTGAAQVYCPFRGYYTSSCNYRWWVKSVQTPVSTQWSGVRRIEARVYRSTSGSVYAMIGYKRPGDDFYQYHSWSGILPGNSWTTIYLDEPFTGAFSNLTGVSVLFGAYSADGNVYVDLVRGLKLVAVAPTLVSPGDSVTIQDNTPNLVWSGDGDSYTLQIDTDPTFATPTIYTGITAKNYTVPDPLPNSGGYSGFRYYWRVQANYSNGQNSAFSSAYRLEINGPHEVPSEFPDIRSAYNAFQRFSGGTILVAPGTYTGPNNCNLGGFGEKPVHVTSSGGAGVTIIDCQGLYRGFYYDLYSVGGTRLDGFTIRNAIGIGDNAAVVCWTGSPDIRNCVIETTKGKGIYCRSGAQPKITNCRITGSDSAGVVLESGTNATITGCNFANNRTYGLEMRDGTTAQLNDCDFLDVLPGSGGTSHGISASGATLTVSNSNFSNSRGTGVAGWNSALAIRNCIFSGNKESFAGGGIGIWMARDKSVTIDSCLFENNSAPNGGGIFLSEVAALNIARSTFVSNSIGIDVSSEGSVAKPISINNSIIAFSSIGAGVRSTNTSIALSLACCDIFGNTGGDWVGTIAGQLGVNNNIRLDPLFCDTANHDYTIATISPCAASDTPCGQIGRYATNCTLNQPPVFALTRDTVIAEGTSLSLTVSATDPDGTVPSLSAENLPANSTFSSPAGGSGTLLFSPNYVQAGVFPIRFIATDGELSDTLLVTITVSDVNRPPVLDAVRDTAIAEGATLSLVIRASDPDGTTPVLTATGLPLHATFSDNRNGTGTFTFSPQSGQSGNYIVGFIASDGELADSATTSIRVYHQNQIPEIFVPNDTTVNEGRHLVLTIYASDPDETIPLLTASNLPSGAAFTDNHDGSGTFSWTPSLTQAGNYVVTFRASDGELSASGSVSIHVTDVNQAPKWADARDTLISTNDSLSLVVSAVDPDGTHPYLSAENLPSHSQFMNRADGSGVMTLYPDVSQEGAHLIRFIASDGILTDTMYVTVTVTLGPILAVQPDTLVFQNDQVTASISISNAGAGILDWTATTVDAAWMSLDQTSGSLAESEAVTVTVSADTSGMSCGSHSGQVVIDSNEGEDTVTTTIYRLLSLMMPPILTSVHVVDSIRIPFNGLIDSDLLLAAVVVETESHHASKKMILQQGERTILFVTPLDGQEFAELDLVKVRIGPNLHDAHGVPLRTSDTLRVFLTGAVVWPGDTNADGVVDERDILPIGVYFDQQGPPRQEADLGWYRQFGYAVVAGSAWEPYQSTYADADGNGRIAYEDICAVSDNWMKSVPNESLTLRSIDSRASLQNLGPETIRGLYTALLDCGESQGRVEIKEMLQAMLIERKEILPDRVTLYQNYPNPLNPTTTIEFYLPDAAQVIVTILNVLGQEVRTLCSGDYSAGFGHVEWNGTDDLGREVASGVYYYRLQIGDFTVTRAMLLSK